MAKLLSAGYVKWFVTARVKKIMALNLGGRENISLPANRAS
jgi:hypothetical protein